MVLLKAKCMDFLLILFEAFSQYILCIFVNILTKIENRPNSISNEKNTSNVFCFDVLFHSLWTDYTIVQRNYGRRQDSSHTGSFKG